MALKYAALPRRGAAFLFDGLFLVPAAFGVAVTWPAAPLAVVFLPALVYWTLFEASPWQASPGMYLLRLKAIEAQGRRVTLLRALLHTALLLSPVLFLGQLQVVAAVLIAAALTGIVLHPKRRAWHDLLSGTSVICVPPPE
jgi:uncharacterized RDD family membrane protein YckC